jgi:hypothetical protein
MALPFSRKAFVAESRDQTKAWWPGNHGDVLPLLVAFEDFPWRCRELLIDAAVFLNVPHTILCLYYLWHVKECCSLRHNDAANPSERARPRGSALSGLLDEAATRRKSGGNRATGFTIFTSPHLARGLFLINRCDVNGERGLHINRAVCLESGHNRCANANRGRRLPQRFRPTPWRSTVFPAKSCIRYFPQIYIFSRLSQPHGPGSSNKRFRSWLRFSCTI